MEILRIHNLSCGYKDGFRLNGLNLKLEKGVFAGIIGRNGSGKTTLFKGIAGDLKSSKQSVWLDTKEASTLSLRDKARFMAIVSQFVELSPITVEEYVLMGRMPYRTPFQFFHTTEDRQIALHYLKLTGMLHLRGKQMTELSGGEQQIVSIACALTQQPKLLLLDEPTSHLDITHQVRIMNLLQQLNEAEGLTIVMIIHDLNMAGEYCNQLILMKEGQIVQQGAPSEVLTYEHIEAAYNTVVIVKNNPISNKPNIFTISERRLKEYAQAEPFSPNLDLTNEVIE
ncbi:MAG: hypothetical protein RL662_669 [Bacteroidota bacterium]|jgi:iron complex transport system ATP-binding protein